MSNKYKHIKYINILHENANMKNGSVDTNISKHLNGLFLIFFTLK